MTLSEYHNVHLGQIVEMDEGFFRVLSKSHEPIPEMEDRYFIQAEIVLTKNFNIPSHRFTPWRLYKSVRLISSERFDKYLNRLENQIGELQSSLKLLKLLKNET